MKRIISIALVLVVAVSCFANLSVFAEKTVPSIRLKAPEQLFTYDKNQKIATATKYFNVAVELTENSGLAGIQFDVVFDNSKLALKGVSNSGIFSDCYYNDKLTSPCTVMLYNNDITDSEEIGNVVLLNFGVKSSVTYSDLKFEIKNIVAFNEKDDSFAPSCAPLIKSWCSHNTQEWKYVEIPSVGSDGTADYWCKTCGTVFDNERVTMPLLKDVNWEYVSNYFYTGKSITPKISGSYYSKEFNRTLILKQNVNFKIDRISDNIKPGTATFSVTSSGCKGYSGIKNNLEFKIVKPTVKLSATSYEYNGKAKTPTATVYIGSKKLVAGTDFTVSYKNNKNPGKASVLITGKGNYAGTYTCYFKILPKAPSLTTYKSTAKGKLTVAVSKTSVVTGYEFQAARNTKFTSGKKTYTSTSYKTNSKTFTKLSRKKYYYVRVRSYTKVGSTKYYGKWCAVKKVKIK